uniref:Uncharacterized protein n=1 Tax=Glossina pallidipes TaxID=7398 RepID=A0A1A9Z1R5_GLOPL
MADNMPGRKLIGSPLPSSTERNADDILSAPQFSITHLQAFTKTEIGTYHLAYSYTKRNDDRSTMPANAGIIKKIVCNICMDNNGYSIALKQLSTFGTCFVCIMLHAVHLNDKIRKYEEQRNVRNSQANSFTNCFTVLGVGVFFYSSFYNSLSILMSTLKKTIEELCEEMNEDVHDVAIGIDLAVDLGILHKIEKIGTAVKFADSTAEVRLTIIRFPRQMTMSPVPAMLTVGAEEVVRRREAEVVEKKERSLVLRPVVGPALARVRGPDHDPDLDPARDPEKENFSNSPITECYRWRSGGLIEQNLYKLERDSNVSMSTSLAVNVNYFNGHPKVDSSYDSTKTKTVE